MPTIVEIVSGPFGGLRLREVDAVAGPETGGNRQWPLRGIETHSGVTAGRSTHAWKSSVAPSGD